MKYGLQPIILQLLNKVNLSAYYVPAGNACFVRSTVEWRLPDKLDYYNDICWDFYQNVTDKLEVKLILCFGNTSWKFVCYKLNANRQLYPTTA